MTAVLVDLDGTVVDSRSGIISSYQFALQRLGVQVPNATDLEWVIGPPSRRSFPKLLGPGLDVEEAVRLYREHYADHGIFDAAVYNGIVEALVEIRSSLSGRIFLCTAKPLPYARRIIEHFRLGHLFDGLYGAEFGDRFDDKGYLIAHILEIEGLDPRRAVMIGDRDNDVRAARRHDIPSVGVLWGYGSADELSGAGATVLCHAPCELPSIVVELFASRALTRE
jgi:phosphoglycolate phosphatase